MPQYSNKNNLACLTRLLVSCTGIQTYYLLGQWLMVKWSACSPSTQMIEVRNLLKIKLSKMLKNNENKQKEAGDGPLMISLLRSLLQFSLDHAHFTILLLDS